VQVQGPSFDGGKRSKKEFEEFKELQEFRIPLADGPE
jgi:hypothetical protein